MDNQTFKRKQIMKSGVVGCSRRRKQNRKDLPPLPSEMIFNILSRLPAEFLHNKGKYVCQTWANIISDPAFVQTHLLHSNAGFLIQDRVKSVDVRFLEAKEGKIRVTCQKKSHFPVKILASCDGILLSIQGGLFYVINCVTKRCLKLPSFQTINCNKLAHCDCGIACIPHTRNFKVIVPCIDLDGFGHWHVLTVGTDGSWRKIDSGLKVREFILFMNRPISINGVIYWASYDVPFNTFLAVDLRDESFHFIKVPNDFLIEDEGRQRNYGFQKMGNHLSCIVRGANPMEIHVWILKNLYSSEWAKIRKIEYTVGLKVPIWDHWYYMPVIWLDNGRLLLFFDMRDVATNLIAYILSTGAMRIIKNVHHVNSLYMFEHTKSLVSW